MVLVLHVREEGAWRYTQRGGELPDRRECRVPDAVLGLADVGAPDASGMCELLLRQAGVGPDQPKGGPESAQLGRFRILALHPLDARRPEVAPRPPMSGVVVDFERHTEGGGHPVDGLKFYRQSSRLVDDDGDALPNSRMILGLALVPKKRSGGEAGVAVRKLLELKKRAAGMLGVRYDGALRGVHLDELMKAGLAVVNPPHEQTAGREEFRTVTCEHVDKSTGVICDQATTLYKQNGALGVLEVLADEAVTVLFHALPGKVIARGKAPEARWYVELTLPCGHSHLERLTSSATDAKTGFNRAEHLRMHPPGSPVYDQTYAWRNDAESSHSQLDDWLYRGRMVALTTERQALVMLSFAVTHNAVADWYHRRRQRDETPGLAA